MGMGGNAATQTLTVIIRGLALNEVPGLARVLSKQLVVDIGNGLINGLIAGVVGILISRSLWIGLVLALAMLINMIVSGLAGTLTPVALKKMGIDPAVASTVFVTTFTDVGGSLSFLGLATILLRALA
jgi:magnesium transporter